MKEQAEEQTEDEVVDESKSSNEAPLSKRQQVQVAMKQAEDGGADDAELRKLKQMLSFGLPSATKKIITPEKRKAKQKAFKKARKAQRGKK